MQTNVDESKMISLGVTEKSSEYIEGQLAFHCDEPCLYVKGSRDYEEWHKGYAAEDQKEFEGGMLITGITIAFGVLFLVIVFVTNFPIKG